MSASSALAPYNPPMKKVVINTCYGGYGLSAACIQRLAELQGYKTLYVKENGLFPQFFTVPLDELPTYTDWHKMSIKDRQAYNRAYENVCYGSDRFERDDPLLIQVIEELGEELCSGSFAKLKVVEIPVGIEYQIEEYDGREWIAETHRTWG